MSLLKKITHPSKWYIIGGTLLLYDTLTILGSFFAALYISYECEYRLITANCLDFYLWTIPFYLILCLLVYSLFKFYNCIWRLVSYYELSAFTLTVLLLSSTYFIIGMIYPFPLPKRYYIIGGWLQLWLVLVCRFAYRFLVYLVLKMRSFTKEVPSQNRAMLIGAGAAGQIILRDVIASEKADVEIKCIIDDNPAKWYCRMSGVPVVGGRDDILLNIKKYRIEEILFAIPTISAEEKRNILHICQESGCKLRMLPSIFQLVNGDVSLASMKPVEVEELLGREPIRVNNEEILESLNGKVILVTGGGGSIGSELCRQIASHNPKQLIIFDIYENNAYDIQQELKRTYPKLNLAVLIGSVRDTTRIRQVFEAYKPEIVFHAAAHKHVPLMEASPYEAVKNNVLGTYKTAFSAMLNGCRRFVLISTDKAVNPTNVMGATKRLCEIVIQVMNAISASGDLSVLPDFLRHHGEFSTESISPEQRTPHVRTEFVAVRFGNVLGSNGSVIPLFRKQIEEGGPVTVTHPDIIRYFMTIPEAVSLVLQASTYANGGEIFVLDMGEPVKIDTLARNLIKLSGFKPDIDIKIEYTGLRPGEKLYEEKLMVEEGMRTTSNKLIYIAKPLAMDFKPFLKKLAKLANLAYNNKKETITLLKELVPNFQNKQ